MYPGIKKLLVAFMVMMPCFSLCFPFCIKGLIFTRHAQQRMRMRAITHAQIINTLNRGTRAQVLSRDKASILKFEHNAISVITDSAGIKVITAFWNHEERR